MDGSATLTIDTSSTTMNWATQAMAKMTQSGTRCPFGVLGVSLSMLSASAMKENLPLCRLVRIGVPEEPAGAVDRSGASVRAPLP